MKYEINKRNNFCLKWCQKGKCVLKKNFPSQISEGNKQQQ